MKMPKSSCRISIEQRNCYCNSTGIWSMDMIQCNKCRRWFHHGCIRSLRKPVLCGDRFFVFVCSICNSGTEFLCRLELKWMDIAHLALYNLSVINKKKYSDFHGTLIPFINDNWTKLRLLGEASATKPEERKNSILNALTGGKKWFKNGREIKKSQFLWGLRELLPPIAPHVNPTAKHTEDSNGVMWEFRVPGRKSKVLHGDKRLIKIEVDNNKPAHLHPSVALKRGIGNASASRVQNTVKKNVNKAPQKSRPVFKDTEFKMNLMDSLIPMPVQFTFTNNPFRNLSKPCMRSSPKRRGRKPKLGIKRPVIHRLSEERHKDQVLANGHHFPNTSISRLRNRSNLVKINENGDCSNGNAVFMSRKHLFVDNTILSKKLSLLQSNEFTINGKRVTSSGRVEYLLEWDK